MSNKVNGFVICISIGEYSEGGGKDAGVLSIKQRRNLSRR